MFAYHLNNDAALEWMLSIPINEEVRPKGRRNMAFAGRNARRQVNFAGLAEIARNYNSAERSGRHDSTEDHEIRNPLQLSRLISTRMGHHSTLPKVEPIDFPEGVLPALEDPWAKNVYLFRRELLDIRAIDSMQKLNHIILAVTQLSKEKNFAATCNELLAEWSGPSFVPIPAVYYDKNDYFWIVVYKLRKMIRRHGSALDDVITKLTLRFDTELGSKIREVKIFVLKELQKFVPLIIKIKGFELFFKVDSKHDLLESEYKKKHKKICALVQQLNMIYHDMSLIELSDYHKLYFLRNFQLSKKRLFTVISEVHTRMKRAAARNQAMRMASCQHFVEIAIEKKEIPLEPEPLEKNQMWYDSDEDSFSSYHSSEEGWASSPQSSDTDKFEDVENTNIQNNDLILAGNTAAVVNPTTVNTNEEDNYFDSDEDELVESFFHELDRDDEFEGIDVVFDN